MEYYSSKGKRQRAEQRQDISYSSNQTTTCKTSLRDMKSFKAPTMSNTPITTTSYDDSDDELGAEIYRTSETAKRHREEQQQALSTSTQTTTRRKSSRLLNIESREDKEKSLVSSKPTSTANKTNTKRISRSNKRKAAVLSVDEEVDDGMAPVLKEEFRKGSRLCLSAGCTSIVINGGVCRKHGAKVKTCSHEGCNKHVQKGGVCMRHGAKVKKYTCTHEGCTNQVVKEGVCIKHGAVQKKRKICSHKGCTNYVQNSGVCTKHGAKVITCSHKGCNKYAQKGGVCMMHGAVVKRTMCTVEGCTSRARGKDGVCTKHGK